MHWYYTGKSATNYSSLFANKDKTTFSQKKVLCVFHSDRLPWWMHRSAFCEKVFLKMLTNHDESLSTHYSCFARVSLFCQCFVISSVFCRWSLILYSGLYTYSLPVHTSLWQRYLTMLVTCLHQSWDWEC